MGHGAYVIAAGGTGGHIYPGIALAEEIRARRPDAKVVFVGAGGLERKLVPAAGFALELVTASGFMGKSLSNKIASLRQLPGGFREARKLLVRLEARAVVGMGGYVSLPVVAAARSLGIPTLIHEPNARPGLANRLLNRVVSQTAVGIMEANGRFARPGVITGTPVRAAFFGLPPLDPAATTRRVLIFGGSQGSRVLNRAMAKVAPALITQRLQVIHQTGEMDFAAAKKRYYKIPPGWRIEPFLPKMWEDFGWADLIVSRAGALTVAEIAAAGRPSILVPFAAATEAHQLANAKALTRAGAAVTMREDLVETNSFAAVIEQLFLDRKHLVKMAENARKLAKPEAAKNLVELLFEAEAEG